MQAILKIISLILWAIDYAKNNPKKTTAATLGSGVVAMGLYSGVPSYPAFVVEGTKVDGHVPTVQADLTVDWEAGGGGSGITIDGTITDGDSVAYDATDSVYTPDRLVQNVKNFVGGKRAAGTAAQTTATATASNATIALASAATWERGHGGALIGGGAAHGISAPTNCYAIPRTAYAGTPGSSLLSAIPFTVSTSTNRLSLPIALASGRARIQIPDGQGVRFDNQGGTLPTYVTTTAFTADTTYYLRNAARVATHAMSGTPTGGTYKWTDEWTGNSVNVAYNASSATLQAALRTLPGYAQVTVSESGSTPNFTHTITFTGVPGNPFLLYDFTNLTGGTPAMTITETTTGGWTIHPTAADAIANTNAYDLDGAGTGTHYLTVYGDRTYEYQVSALSGNGGMTAASTAFQTTLGPHELSRYTHMMLVGDVPSGSKGYVFYGDGTSNKKALMVCAKMSPVVRVTLQAGGFTAWEWGDVGRTVSDGTNTGTLLCYDESSRNMWVRPTVTNFGSNGATITTTSGTGGGTQTGASVAAFAFIDWGNDKDTNLGTCVAYDDYLWYPRLQRRCDEQIYPGQLMETGGNFYTCTKVFPGPNEWGPLDRKTQAPVAFTINTTTNVITTASADSITTGTGLYITSTVALPTHTATTRFQESALVYLRQVTSSTYTLHPSSADASANTNVYDLIADGVGTYYVLMSPTFSTTLNAYTTDDRVQWRREDQTFPVSPPSSAIADIHLFSTSSKSSNDLVISPAPTTSVTSALILHDDTDAMLAHWEVVRGSSAKAFTFKLPKGEYPLVSLDNGTESRWFNSAFDSGNNSLYLFRWFGPSSTVLDCEWDAEPGTRVIWQALSRNCGIPLGSGDGGMGLHSFAYCKPVFRNIEWCLWPKGAPNCEDANGTDFYGIFGIDTDATAGGGIHSGARIDGPKFYGGGFYAFPYFGSNSWTNSEATAEVYQDFVGYYGGANHDPGFYTNGGFWNRCQIFGIRAERSMMFYQDYDDGIPMRLKDCRFEGAMKDGIAVRSHDFLMEGCTLIDCVKVFSRENLNGFTVRDCKLVDTSIIPHNTANWSQDVTLENLRILNGSIGMNAGNTNLVVNNVRITQSGRLGSYTTTGLLADFVATGQTIRDVTINNRGWYSYDMRSLILGGNGTSLAENVRVTASSGTWTTLGTSGSGPKTMKDCYFWCRSGGSTASIIAHTGEMKVINCRFGGNTYTWDGGGRTDFEGCTLDSGASFTFGTGITGPTYVRRNQWIGSVSYNEPSMVIEDNNHAAAPGMAGATQATRGNRVADVLSVTPAALASGVTNDYALPVTDQVRLDPNASNSTITSFVARADGTEVTIICTDAGAATITIDSSAATGTAANKIMCPGDTDIVMSTGERIVIRYDATTSLWYVIGGQYVAMDWQGGAIQLWQQGEQFNQPATRELALAA